MSAEAYYQLNGGGNSYVFGPKRCVANTPWTERMRPHFRDHLRFECRRYARAQ